MNAINIPYEDQVKAVAGLEVEELLKKYISDYRYRLDPRPYINVKKSDIVAYYDSHPDMASERLRKCNENRQKLYHDVEILFQRGDNFIVASLDHGKIDAAREFNTLSEACAEYVLGIYGMLN